MPFLFDAGYHIDPLSKKMSLLKCTWKKLLVVEELGKGKSKVIKCGCKSNIKKEISENALL